MTEQQIKAITKFCLDNGRRKLTDEEKELIKLAIDQSSNWEEKYEYLALNPHSKYV